MADPSANLLAFPRVDTPIVLLPEGSPDDGAGRLSRPWYQFLRNLYLRVGAASSTLIQGTTNVLGEAVVSTPIAGGPAETLTLSVSPQEFHAVFQGTLVVFGATVDLSRDAGATWMPVTTMGGAVPLLAGDRARMTWYGDPPPCTFLPGGIG